MCINVGISEEKILRKKQKYRILLHHKTSHLQTAVFNNVLGITPATPGARILKEGPLHLKKMYPHVEQIIGQKVSEIFPLVLGYVVHTNKNSYKTKTVILAVGYTDLFTIKGLEIHHST